jgi:tetratricopeptide (TPR) repeat protein
MNDHIPEVHLNLGHCYFYTENFSLAVENYIKAIKLVKNTRHDYYYFLGNALVANMRIKDGIIAYQAAIKLKWNKLNYYYAIAKACYVEKLYLKGIKYLEKLLEYEKNKNIVETDKDYTTNDALFLLYKLNICLPDVDYEKCTNIIKTLVRNEPKNIEYLEIMAELQEKNQHIFDAIKTYKQILRIEPNNYEARKKLNSLNPNKKKKSYDSESEKYNSSSSESDMYGSEEKKNDGSKNKKGKEEEKKNNYEDEDEENDIKFKKVNNIYDKL